MTINPLNLHAWNIVVLVGILGAHNCYYNMLDNLQKRGAVGPVTSI